MTTASPFADAIDTAVSLGWDLAGLIVVAAVVGCIVIFTAGATGVWAAGATRRAIRTRRH